MFQSISQGMGLGIVKNLALLKAKQPHVSLSAHLGLFLNIGPLSYSQDFLTHVNHLNSILLE